MTGGVICDDGGGHEHVTGVVIGDEGGGQVTKPALISTDANLKFLSKKEVSRSETYPPVSNQREHPAPAGSSCSTQQGSLSAPTSPASGRSTPLREWDEDIEGTPAALIRRAIIYHYDHNSREYHRTKMSVSHVRRKYQEMIEEVPEGWEPPISNDDDECSKLVEVVEVQNHLFPSH